MAYRAVGDATEGEEGKAHYVITLLYLLLYCMSADRVASLYTLYVPNTIHRVLQTPVENSILTKNKKGKYNKYNKKGKEKS